MNDNIIKGINDEVVKSVISDGFPCVVKKQDRSGKYKVGASVNLLVRRFRGEKNKFQAYGAQQQLFHVSGTKERLMEHFEFSHGEEKWKTEIPGKKKDDPSLFQEHCQQLTPGNYMAIFDYYCGV